MSTRPVPMRLLPDTARIESDGSLSIGGCSVEELAEVHGTPLFVYDEEHLRSRCREAVAAFGVDRVIYASKAFLCSAMARLVDEEGLLIDVASGGEMYVAMHGGVSADRCVFHGNNKSLDELRMALTAGAQDQARPGVRHIVVDSFDELDRLDHLHAEGLPTPRVMVRVTPGIHAHTHDYIATGQDDSKFGFNLANGDAAKAVERVRRSASAELIGVHCHIGSNVFAVESCARAAEVMAAFSGPLDLPELTLGGGLGVAYTESEEAPTLSAWGSVLLDACRAHGVRSAISVEPGRSIVAGGAVTVYRVGTVKHIEGIRTYVSVDGGMSDNPRPVLYGSGYEAFSVGDVAAGRDLDVRIVGKHCESGDVLIFDGNLPADVRVGDLVATPVTGAYGHSMASNYNKIPRPAVVFVADGSARLVVRRETYEDLVRLDIA
ncbi:MAG: diaminopimelate decarboxylase [Actinomycetota bacterium]